MLFIETIVSFLMKIIKCLVVTHSLAWLKLTKGQSVKNRRLSNRNCLACLMWLACRTRPL